jgi:hypothetical protein
VQDAVARTWVDFAIASNPRQDDLKARWNAERPFGRISTFVK